MKIIHIGEVRAQELISLRPFASLDDLTRIKGIGEARVKDIKEQGLAWVSQPPQEQAPPAKTDDTPPPLDGLPDSPQEKLPVLLPAIVLASFSGVIILLLKKSLKQVRIEKTHERT